MSTTEPVPDVRVQLRAGLEALEAFAARGAWVGDVCLSFGVPSRLVEAYVLAVHMGADPLSALARRDYGVTSLDQLGPLALRLLRAQVARLNAAGVTIPRRTLRRVA